MESRLPPVVNAGLEAILWLEDFMHMIFITIHLYVSLFRLHRVPEPHVSLSSKIVGQVLLDTRRDLLSMHPDETYLGAVAGY